MAERLMDIMIKVDSSEAQEAFAKVRTQIGELEDRAVALRAEADQIEQVLSQKGDPALTAVTLLYVMAAVFAMAGAALLASLAVACIVGSIFALLAAGWLVYAAMTRSEPS